MWGPSLIYNAVLKKMILAGGCRTVTWFIRVRRMSHNSVRRLRNYGPATCQRALPITIRTTTCKYRDSE